MGKQIPIDDLFRDGLYNAEEQLNLGAWANMERMLDGKNPYAEEETKRKRRIIPFILFFTLLSGLLSAGYYKMSHHSESKVSTSETVKSAPLASNLVSNTSAENTQNGDQEINQKNVDIEENNNKNNKIVITSTSLANNDKPAKTKNRNKHTYTSKIENASEENEDANKSESNNNNQITKSQKSTSKSNNVNNNTPIDENNESFDKSRNTSLAKQQKGPNPSVGEAQFEKVTTTKKENINQIELTQKVKRNRNGSIDVSFDTIAISKKEIEKEHIELVAIEKPKTIDNENFHPRYKQLTKEEEENMNQSSQLPVLASSAPIVEATIHSTPSLTSNKETAQTKKPETQGFFDKLREFANNSYQKMTAAAITTLDLNVPAYTGMSLGVNAAVFNQKNNFGGFHIGVSNIKPISETFSILTELKFFLKNNSGYTIKDVSTKNRAVTVDNVTLANQNKSIYTYQMDSTVSGYNFKSFTSLEMPIMFQTHIGTSVIAYGGVNMAYNFRLNIKEVKTNYVVNKKETLDNSIPFYPVAELGKKYARDDFASRFGLGYTIGASYSFNPNIYLDLRLTKNVWDNAKTNSAKEIAGSYFTIPTIQFSLGYRFRKFDPKR